MKTKILILSVVMILLFGFCISAQDAEYSLAVPNDFAVTHKSDNLQEVSNRLSLTTDTLSEYFTKNGMLYLAVSDDAKTQVRLSAFGDNFSSEVGDIKYLDDTGLKEFISAVGDSDNVEVITNADRKFVITKSTLKDSGGVYTVTQYITIANYKTYYLSCYNIGDSTSDQITSIFNSFSLTENQIAPNYTLQTTLIWVGIIVFSAIAVIMIIGIVKSNLKHKNSEKHYEI